MEERKMAETITVIVLAALAFGGGIFGVWYINQGEDETNKNDNE